MRILLIGGTGFIGRRVAARLIVAGHDVAIVHRGETTPDMPAPVQYIFADRAHLGRVAPHLLRFRPQIVVDLIAYTEADAMATLRILRTHVERWVVVSSADVYANYGRLLRLEPGDPDPAPLDEHAPLRTRHFPYRTDARGPDDRLYHYDKILVERAYRDRARAPVTILRLPMVYGPGDPQQRIAPYLRRMDDGRSAILVDADEHAWRWTPGYVEDVADAVAATIERPATSGATLNLGRAASVSQAEWIRRIGEAAQWEGEVLAVPAASLPAHLVRYLDWRASLALDASRARALLAPLPLADAAEAMRRTVVWQRTQPLTPAVLDGLDYSAEDAALSYLRA